MDFSKYIEEEKIKERKKNLEQVRAEIDKSWVRTKIDNYVKRWGGMFTQEEVRQGILTNDMIASSFAKDPTRQNISEKAVENILGIKKLPQAGGLCVCFDDNGNKVSSGLGITKSADFYYNGYYATQKYTTNAGGAQDNQKNDVIDFLKRGSIKHKVMAIVDGDYWDKHVHELRLIFKNNPNVVITSLTEITGG